MCDAIQLNSSTTVHQIILLKDKIRTGLTIAKFYFALNFNPIFYVKTTNHKDF